MRRGFNRKSLVVGAIVLLLLTGLSPVYAEITYSESTSIKNKTAETTTIDNINLLDRKSFLDKYDSSEIDECYHSYSDFCPYGQHNPIRKPTLVDGEEWDIIVPDDYPTIQEAVNSADMGYRILVQSGTYKENVEIDVQSLTLRGEDKDATIIDGCGTGHVIMIASGGDGVNLSGFSLQNSGDGFSGINVSSLYNIIEDNIIQDNGQGINLYYSSGNQIQNNRIINNDGDGIWPHRSNGNDIKGNILTKNKGDGIAFTYSSLGSTVEDNIISGNVNSGILIDESSLGNTMKGNTIENNEFGVNCIGVSDGNTFHHNSFIGNNVNAYDNSLDLWDYEGIGNYWDDYTGVDKNGDGIGDTPYVIPGGDNKDRYPLMNSAVMTVNSKQDWVDEADDESRNIWVSTASSSLEDGWDITVPDDYPTIQEAVDHANPGDSIFVRSGIYYENVNISIPGLTLYGEDKETTVIDGGGKGHVVFVNGVADGFDISGFTIRSKENHFTGLYLYSDSTSVEDIICEDCNIGIALRDNENNFVEGNEFVSNNYGIWTWMCTDSTLEDNVIKNSELDGMALQKSTRITIDGNWIQNNTFNGILQMSCWNTSVTENFVEFNGRWPEAIFGNFGFGIQMFSSINNAIKGNNINNNTHDGVSLFKSTNNTLRDNTILNNLGGVSFWYYSRGNCIDKNEIKSNWIFGVYFYYSSSNTILGNNISNTYYDGIFNAYSNNNIFSGNSIISSNNGDGLVLEYFSSSNIILGNTLSLNDHSGILLGSSSNNIISENTISNNSVGVFIGYSSNNIISENTISNNYRGMKIPYSSNNIISENIIIGSNNYYGISLFNSSNNALFGNTVSSNSRDSIYLEYYSSDNIITGNNITNNYYGIQIDDSSNNNRIHHNNFINNSWYTYWHAYDEGDNVWDDGEEGNYWDDYTGIDSNDDGIGDTPYRIFGGENWDNYPLMEPWSAENLCPYVLISGPTRGKVGTWLTFNLTLIDPDGDQGYCQVDWGDSTTSDWLGPLESGETITVKHRWLIQGQYPVRVRGKDVGGNICLWSEPVPLTIPKTKTIDASFLFSLLEKLMERFPLLEQLLQFPWLNFDWHPAREPYDIGG